MRLGSARGRRLFIVRKALLLLVFLLFVLPTASLALFRFVPVPLTPLMVLRLFEGEGLEKNWEPLSSISRHLADAVIAAEDNRFCEHGGVDWKAVGKVIDEYRRDGRLRGASTISMQTAKNLFLWPGRSYLRKGVEAYLTLLMEGLWPKRRILEVYLNIVEWGPGIYGAEAAAQHYFDVPAERLSRRQASLLAVTLPNPRNWSPTAAAGGVPRRATTIGRRIGQLGPLLDCY